MSSVNYFHNFPKLARDSGFALKENDNNDGYIDWRFIASIDTNRIVKDSDFEKLEECLPHLINSALGSVLNTRILDPAIGKFYTISQLCIQYLLFCKQFLDKTVNDLRDNIFQSQRSVFKLEKMLQKREDEVQSLQKKIQKQEITHQVVYPCTKCTKNFISSDLLNVHMTRKHQANTNEFVDKDSNLIQTIKLELEIKQLKERLNIAEKELVDQKQSITECVKCKNETPKKVCEIGIQSNIVEAKEIDVKDTYEHELKEILNLQQQQLQEWKKEEERKYNLEINELRSKLDDTIEILKKEKENAVPQVQRVVDKCLDTSSLLGTGENDQRTKEEENLWKTRCKEMEQMYQQNQKKTTQTLENLEKIYNEKMRKFEMSLKKAIPEPSQPVIQPKKSMFPDKTNEPSSESEEMEDQGSSNVQNFDNSSDSEDDEKVLPKKIEVPVIVEPRPRTKVDVQKVSLSQKQFHPKKLKKIKEKSPKNDEETSKKVQKDFEKIKEPNLKLKIPENLIGKPKVKSNESPPEKIARKAFESPAEEKVKEPTKASRMDAVKLFKSRLKSFGIDPKDQLMNKSKYNKVNEDLAVNREETKKKYKSFFITRKSLMAKVDEILMENSQKTPKSDPKSSKKTKLAKVDEILMQNSQKTPKSEQKSSKKTKLTLPTVEIVKSKDSSEEKVTESEKKKNPFKRDLEKSPPKNEQLVNVDVEKQKYPAIKEVVETEPPNQAKNFRDNLEKLLQKQIGESTLTLKPKLEDLDEIREEKSDVKIVAPKSASKKKVLFNLDTIEENSSKNQSPPKVEEGNTDSDWNISSFEEDEIVLKN